METTKTKKSKTLSSEKTILKAKSLFDHITHIREVKSKNYIKDCTEYDLKSFNKYMILRGLSMDKTIIDEISYISKYIEILSVEHFYKVCSDIIPKEKKYCKWIKSTKKGYNKELLEFLSVHFQLSTSECESYCDLYMNNDEGLESLKKLLSSYGKTEKEINNLLKNE